MNSQEVDQSQQVLPASPSLGNGLLRWALLGLLLLAFFLRLYQLDQKSLWVDEGYTTYLATRPISAIPRLVATTDNHPPLHYLLLHLWTRLAGDSEYSLRFFSLVAGVLTVALVFPLGKGLLNPRAALVAVGLLAISPFHGWYSQEVRMYALLAFFSTLSLTCLALNALSSPCPRRGLELCRRPWVEILFSPVCPRKRLDKVNPHATPYSSSPPEAGSRRRYWLLWGGFSAGALLGLLTHYYAFFTLAVSPAFVLLAQRKKTWLWHWGLSVAPVVLLFSLWLPALWQQYGQAPQGYQLPTDLAAIAVSLNRAFSLGEWAKGDYAAWAPWGFALVLLLGLLPWSAFGGRPSAGLWVTLMWLLAPLLLAYGLSLALHLNIRAAGRMYYIAALPAYYLLLGRGIVTLFRLRLTPGILGVAAIASISAVSLYDQYYLTPKEDFRAVAQYIAAHQRQGDVILLHAEHIYPVFSYYYRGPLVWHRAVVKPIADETGQWLKENVGEASRVWLVLSHEWVSDPQGQVLDWFQQHGLALDERWEVGIHLLAYSTEARPNFQPPALPRPAKAWFQDKLALLGYDLDALEASPGRLPVRLFWSAIGGATASEDYRVKLMLFDVQGRLWAQTDRLPLSLAYPTSRWQKGEYLTDYQELPLPPGTPPGEYLLKLQVYSPKSGEALRLTGTPPMAGPAQADQLTLEKVVLSPQPTPSLAEAMRSVEVPLRRPLTSGHTLLGASLSPHQGPPGTTLHLTLLWQKTGAGDLGQDIVLQLVDGQGRTIAQQPLFTPNNPYPSSQWKQKEVVRSQHRLLIPGSAEAGEHRLQVLVPQVMPKPLTIATVQVTPLQRLFTVPAMGHPEVATFNRGVELLGYDLDTEEVRAGSVLTLTLYWRAGGTIPDSFKVFTHLVDEAGRLVTQHDGLPTEGKRPTPSWAPGEIITDVHPILIPPDTKPGAFWLRVGLYDPESGSRLPLTGAPIDFQTLTRVVYVRAAP